MSQTTGTTLFPVTPSKAVAHVERCIKKKRVPILKGSPGIGKSDIIRQVAEKYSLKVIDIRLAQIDPVELNGFPNFTADGKAVYAPMNIFPTKGEPLPLKEEHEHRQTKYTTLLESGSDDEIAAFQKKYCYRGWLLFFDEITSANRAVQAAAYKIVLDRMVGQFYLHEAAFCVAAGNLSSDKAVVNQMSTALQSRLIHYTLKVCREEWITWAIKEGLDNRVISFHEWDKTLLHNFEPNHNSDTFPCPRTWHMLSDLIEDVINVDGSLMPTMAGTVGQGAASTFNTFCQVWQDLPSVAQVVANPTTLAVSTDNATRYAIAGMLAGEANIQNISAIIKYMKRLSREFQLIFIRMAFKHTNTLLGNPDFQAMMKEFNADLKALQQG
ncbi:AAA family ATPase [Vibrio phage vB_VhaP_PG11]|nr:AAA family ATPase [Vibrio phage vB_VhaP_PG11]